MTHSHKSHNVKHHNNPFKLKDKEYQITLVEIFEKKRYFFLSNSKQRIPRKEVRKVGEGFHIHYPRESFTLYEEAIKKTARKKGIQARTYNAYTHKLDDTISPIQARIQLYHIPEKIVREEEKRIDERAIDILWDLDESVNPNLYK